jgi:hypothetical protein
MHGERIKIVDWYSRDILRGSTFDRITGYLDGDTPRHLHHQLLVSNVYLRIINTQYFHLIRRHITEVHCWKKFI